ncbi:MAG: Fic family protein [Gemmobacter sp.]
MSHLVAPSRIEPARLEDQIPLDLVETANRLIQASRSLGRNLPPRTLADLAAMVRMMNSYYSNRIEGNNTRPRDIERALAGDYDTDPERRALQQEHAAHVRLQADIDRRAALGTLPDPTGPAFIQGLHRAFYDGATDAMLTLHHAGQTVRIDPGEWRTGDVEVGAHVPPPHATVPAFMAHFHTRFRQDWLHGQVARVLATATAHHRFNYIHPFHDGNGRVSRLMSHAMSHHVGIAAGGLWSVSRGLARGLQDGLPGRDEYRAMMHLADRVRQGDRDGRGALSLGALVTFATWFLSVCEDQIAFMDGMFEFDGLGGRLARYAAMTGLDDRAADLLRIVLLRGEVDRGDIAALLGVAPRTARATIKSLSDDGIVGSDTPRSPLFLRFPSQAHDILFPRLFDVS